MTSLKEARETGKLAQFTKEHHQSAIPTIETILHFLGIFAKVPA
jgi:hypothetical protein